MSPLASADRATLKSSSRLSAKSWETSVKHKEARSVSVSLRGQGSGVADELPPSRAASWSATVEAIKMSTRRLALPALAVAKN